MSWSLQSNRESEKGTRETFVPAGEGWGSQQAEEEGDGDGAEEENMSFCFALVGKTCTQISQWGEKEKSRIQVENTFDNKNSSVHSFYKTVYIYIYYMLWHLFS